MGSVERHGNRDHARALLPLLILLGCGGSPFQQESPDASELAGSASGAGGTSVPSGGAAGSPKGGTGGEPEASSGAGGDADNATPCDRASWIATASIDGHAPFAIDATPGTRWTTNAPRQPEQWFQIEVGEPTRLVTVELHTELFPLDSPSLVRVELDGNPTLVRQSSPAAGVLLLELDGAPARTLRIVALDHGAPVPQFEGQAAWWSIYELTATCR